MMGFALFMHPPFVEALGLALLHALWQVVLVGFVLAVALRVLHSAQARYLASCMALAAMVAVPVVTGLYVYPPGFADPSRPTVLAPWLEAAPSTVDVPAAGGATSPALEATAGSVDWLALGLPWLVAGW
ncbi:MAG: hypothetical protein AAGI71_18595, partial [Bacteroidota bacterium]